MKVQKRSDFLLAATAAIAASAVPRVAATRESVVHLADGISYVPGDIERRLTANTGFIDAEDGLIVVDAAIPEGAAAAYAAIRHTSTLAPRHLINTHYHLDHLYGNAFWNDRGAIPLAYEGVRSELHRAEPELDGHGPGLWQRMMPLLPQLRHSHLVEPHYVADNTSLADGAVRLMHPGVAHTHSDFVVWHPRGRVLFTGDLTANGPYNAVADSTIYSWLGVLDRLAALHPDVVVPGHGPAGGAELIAAQSRYFRAVIAHVDACVRSGRDVKASIPRIMAAVQADPGIAHFVNDHHFPYSAFFAFRDLVAKVYLESTGRQLAYTPDEPPAAHCCGDLRQHLTDKERSR